MCLAGLPGYQLLDSLAVDGEGNHMKPEEFDQAFDRYLKERFKPFLRAELARWLPGRAIAAAPPAA